MTPTQPTRTIPTDPTAPAITPERGADFRTSEGLRVLLHQLHHSGWRDDPQAAALMVYAADKYAPLARKHGLDAWEAASAAFDVMRTSAARCADDPWAVITHAVQITCIYEARAQGLMCSVHQARRAHVSAHHDPERFSDRETPLYEYHPAFHLTDPTDIADDPVNSSTDARIEAMVADAISLFVLLGWPEPPPAPASNTSPPPSRGSAPGGAPSKPCAATSTPGPCSTSPPARGVVCCGSCWATPTPPTRSPRRDAVCCCGSCSATP